MALEHDKAWDNFEQILNLKLPIKEAWNKLIDFYEKEFPQNFWPKIRELDVVYEQSDINEWLEQILNNSPLPPVVKALWIGIAKVFYEEKEIYAIYLTGSDNYDQENIDWTIEPVYDPENKYGIIELLSQIDSIISESDSDTYTFLDWILPLAYCSLTIDEIIRTKLNRALFLNLNQQIFVTTGYGNGDFKALTTIV